MTVVYVCNPACKLDRAGKSYVLLCMYVCHSLSTQLCQLSGFGNWALQKSGFPLCELLIKLGRPGGLLEAFFRELGPFKQAASRYVSC